jgi:hypothetical protein
VPDPLRRECRAVSLFALAECGADMLARDSSASGARLACNDRALWRIWAEIIVLIVVEVIALIGRI